MEIRIVSINEDEGTMVIDWGWTVLNHKIPLTIVENPTMSENDILKELRKIEPIHLKPKIAATRLRRMVSKNVESLTGLHSAATDNVDIPTPHIEDQDVEGKEF